MIVVCGLWAGREGGTGGRPRWVRPSTSSAPLGYPHRRKNGGRYARKNSSPGGSVCISPITWDRIPSGGSPAWRLPVFRNASKYSLHSGQAAQWLSMRSAAAEERFPAVVYLTTY